MTERRKSFAYADSTQNSINNEDLNIQDSSLSNNNNIHNDISSNNSQDLDNLEYEFDQYKQIENDVIEPYYSNGNNNIDNIPNNNLNHNNKNNDNNNNNKDDLKRIITFEHIKEYDNNETVVPTFIENKVGLREYFNHDLRDNFTLHSVKDYFVSLFPIIHWIPHYNLQWFIQDLIAGITVGCVLVPQSMSYAQLATLPPQYGLYSSFIGAYMYSFFATSKDVCIGPVAVMSLETAKVVARVMEKYPEGTIEAPIIATTLALLCGAIALGIGLLRLGFLVELISLNAVAGFMTGSALNIVSGQVPGLMGYNSLVNTRTSTYKVIIETLKHLPDTTLDAVFGLIPLFILYFWKWWCNNMGPKLADKYYPTNSRANYIWKKFYFYAQAGRNGIIIIIFTAISFGITKGKSKAERKISILGTVPKGLRDVSAIKVPEGLAANIAPELPASIIVLLLEHIAISKSFGRVNDYKVVPDQELIAIGVTNLIGTFFHAYPATGSFSRSALKAKCNVKTPFSGVISGSCVLLALYCLTGAFYYIPKATLCAVIIHAVSDLVASYHVSWSFYQTNPLDFISFITTVFICVFSSIENGIYFAMCWSCAMLLVKVTFPAGQFLGSIEVAEVVEGELVNEDVVFTNCNDSNSSSNNTSDEYSKDKLTEKNKGFDVVNNKTGIVSEISSSSSLFNNPRVRYHTKWVPFDHSYTRELNPGVEINPPPSGVIVYRLSDSYTYVNASRHYDIVFDEVKKQTRRGQIIQHQSKADRPWNDPGPWEPPTFLKNGFNFKKIFKKNRNSDSENEFDNNNNNNNNSINSNIEEQSNLENGPNKDDRPLLKIVCFDFSQVSQVDATALQSLVDLRKAINSYADRQVEFHFAGIISPWIKRGLINIGFGNTNDKYSDETIIAGHTSYHVVRQTNDLENAYEVRAATGTNYPFFHVEIPNFKNWEL